MKFSPTQDPSGGNVASQMLASPALSPVTREAVKLVKRTKYTNISINGGQTCFNAEQNVALSLTVLLAEPV